MSSPRMNLPAELRLMIYELAFSPEHSRDEEIVISDTLYPHRPRYDLLAACSEIQGGAQQAFDNAMKLYQDTQLHYSVKITEEDVDKFGFLNILTKFDGELNLHLTKTLLVHFEIQYSFNILFRIDHEGAKVTGHIDAGTWNEKARKVAKRIVAHDWSGLRNGDGDDGIDVVRCLRDLEAIDLRAKFCDDLWPERRSGRLQWGDWVPEACFVRSSGCTMCQNANPNLQTS